MASGSPKVDLTGFKKESRQMENKSQKEQNELNLRSRFSSLHSLQKELHKSAQSLTGGKRAKEFEILLNENEMMQRKLQDQEEEFRLQTETLMAELAQLVKANEELDRGNKLLKESAQNQKDDVNCSALMDEIRHLQAQNTVLQNSLLTCQQEMNQQRCQNQPPMLHNDHTAVILTGEETSRGPILNTADTIIIDAEGNGNLPPFISKGHHTNDSSLNFNGLSRLDITEDAWKLANDLRLNLETEKEEKCLLKELLQSAETKHITEREQLQLEIKRMSEKLKKKQESLLQLQDDKDRLYRELSQKLASLESEKDSEVESIRKQKSQLEQELATDKKLEEERAEHYRRHVSKLEGELMNLQQQLDRSRKESGERLREQTDEYGKEMKRMDEQIHELESSTDDLKIQLKESNEAQACTVDQLLAIQIDRDQQILALQEMNRVADRRKALLDELAIKYQQDVDHLKDQMKTMSNQNAECVKELTSQIDRLNEKLAEFEGLKTEMEALKFNVQQLGEAKNWLERSLKEAEDNLEQTKEFYETCLQTKIADHREAMEITTKEYENSIKAMKTEIEELKREKEMQLEMVNQLKQDIKDGIEDKKLHEKKGTAALKELKRQLAAEQKRGDRLQEKLQELTLETNYRRKSVEELFRYYERQAAGDSRSMSSLSPSGTSMDNIRSQSPDDDSTLSNLQQENEELLKRLAEVQQANWILEEKVSHLEASNAAMADDLIHKAALIDHFSVDAKTGKYIIQAAPQEKSTPLRRMIDFVKDKGAGDESLIESNRRQLNIIEETLTKNMFLQQNLETMSKELHDLRQRHDLPNNSEQNSRLE